jgi:two-component system, NtrC family, response regulator HydG
VKGRLLLVDDNEAYLDSTRDVMEDEGYEVLTATGGKEAVQLVASQQFDVVVMDIKMPGMNGVESFIEMKRFDPGVKVIMCTAYIVENMIRQALEQGALAVLNKPFEMGLLLKTIENVMEERHKGRILLADRDEVLCAALAGILRARGHKVEEVHNGRDALGKASVQDFDILLLEMNLPVVNGMEVYHRIKAMQGKILAAILTGFQEEMDASIQRRLKQEEGALCLTKPLDTVQLLDLLGTIFASKQ